MMTRVICMILSVAFFGISLTSSKMVFAGQEKRASNESGESRNVKIRRVFILNEDCDSNNYDYYYDDVPNPDTMSDQEFFDICRALLLEDSALFETLMDLEPEENQDVF